MPREGVIPLKASKQALTASYTQQGLQERSVVHLLTSAGTTWSWAQGRGRGGRGWQRSKQRRKGRERSEGEQGGKGKPGTAGTKEAKGNPSGSQRPSTHKAMEKCNH